jgi:Mala s 1-like protein
MKFKLSLSIIMLYFCSFAGAQNIKNDYKLPGKGLKQHDFLYAGEWDIRKPTAQSMFLVRGGKVVWQYSIPLRTATGGVQEFDDATLLSNGNIVYACMSGAGVITPQKNIIWQYICAPGTETHSCQPIGKDSVLMVLNTKDKIGKVLIFNTATNKLLKEVVIPTTGEGSHYQFRHVRLTPGRKSFMVGMLNEKKVVELDFDGKELWSVNATAAWAVVRLHNGNTLISGDYEGYTREVNPKGETVWEFTRADAPFKVGNTQTANRLANGNTVITSWIAGDNNTNNWAGTVQVFEVTPEKKIVWALSSWNNPDLGPATAIQLLNEPGNPDNGELQR